MLFDFLNKEGLAYLVNKILKRDVDLTQAEYDALPESKNSDGKNYYIYDSDITVTAEEVGYDGSASGSAAANSQQALDELFDDTKKLNENLPCARSIGEISLKKGSSVTLTIPSKAQGLILVFPNSNATVTSLTAVYALGMRGPSNCTLSRIVDATDISIERNGLQLTFTNNNTTYNAFMSIMYTSDSKITVT